MTQLLSTVAVVDLEAACALYGRDTPPYPLGRSRPVGSVWLASREVGPLPERLDDELHVLRLWLEALAQADAYLECRVSYCDDSTPDVRMHALRAGGSGFIAVQRNPDPIETVELYAVSPEELSEAVSYSVGLVGAGTRPWISVAHAVEEYDDFGFPIPNKGIRGSAITSVDVREVEATGTVQSRPDSERRPLRWVRIRGDGDYLCASDGAGYAEPLSVETLHACVDELIDRC